VPLEIVDLIGDPTLSLISGGSAGVTLHAQVYSGACRVRRRPTKRFEARQPTRLGFYVPQAGPFRPSHLLSAWVEVTPASVNISGQNTTRSGPYGVDGVSVQLVDDTLGSGMMWPYVWMTVWEGDPMLLRYRLTVTQPLENAG
jgi:hypothetical protein